MKFTKSVLVLAVGFAALTLPTVQASPSISIRQASARQDGGSPPPHHLAARQDGGSPPPHHLAARQDGGSPPPHHVVA